MQKLLGLSALFLLCGLSYHPSARAQAADAYELVVTLSADGQPSMKAFKLFSNREECLAGATELERSTRATRGEDVRFESSCEAKGKRVAAVSEPQSKPDRIILWQNLQSGMTPQEIVAALHTQNIRARVFTERTSGETCVEARDKARVAGRVANIDLGCANGHLFHVTLRYEVSRSPGQDKESQFAVMSRALTQTYGPARATMASPKVIHSSSAGIVTRQAAEFQKNGLEIALTVNDAIGRDYPSETVIIRYWRVADAEAYSWSQNLKQEQKQEARDRRLRDGL